MGHGLNTENSPEVVVIADSGDAGMEDPVPARIRAIGRHAGEEIKHCRVRFSRLSGVDIDRPVIGQACLDFGDRRLRAQVSAGTLHEAVEMLVARVRRRIERLVQREESLLAGTVKPDEWWRVGEPTFRPRYVDLPQSERRIVRQKRLVPLNATVDQAALAMDLLDYDFHLFTDVESGQDSVIYRDGPTGYCLAQIRPEPGRHRSTSVPLHVSRHPAPMRTVEQAKSELDASGMSFMFFVDPASRRGRALYRRYDGHYGLLTPDESDEPGELAEYG